MDTRWKIAVFLDIYCYFDSKKSSGRNNQRHLLPFVCAFKVLIHPMLTFRKCSSKKSPILDYKKS